jgi:RNA polymerase sigma factor (sigma-70 family)
MINETRLHRIDRATPDSSEQLAQSDEVDRLLSALPAKQRVAVVLRYLYDQTDAQIAEVLGCATTTVRSHLSHARATLRLTAGTDTERA